MSKYAVRPNNLTSFSPCNNPKLQYDSRGCPRAWTPYALKRQYARVIWRAKPSNKTGVEPIRQLSNFFHDRPGLRAVIGRRLLKFITGDAQSTKLRPDHPAVLKFKRKENKEKCRRRCDSWRYRHCDCDCYIWDKWKFWRFCAATVPGAVLAIALGIAASLINGFGLGSSRRAIAGAAGGLQSCMNDVGLGHFCFNNSYQCGGSPSLSSTNITFVSSNPQPILHALGLQPLSDCLQ